MREINVTLNDNQRGALTSFVYNLGHAWLTDDPNSDYKTDFYKRLRLYGQDNRNDDPNTIIEEEWWEKFHRCEGVPTKGLCRRRHQEILLFTRPL